MINNLNLNIVLYLNQFNSQIIHYISSLPYVLVILALYLSYKKSINHFILNGFWFFLLYVFIQATKQLTNIARPCFEISNLKIILSSIYTSMSFPSGHTAIAFFVLAIIPSVLSKIKFKNLIYTFVFASAFLAGISRIIMGLHWPIDVFFGAIFGFAFGKMTLLYKVKTFVFHNLELRRQIVHLCLGLFISLLIAIFPKTLVLLYLGGFFIIVLIIEYFYNKNIFPISLIINNLKRKKETPTEGAIYFLIGALITIFLFEKNIAVICVLMLAVGDSFATIFGTHFYSKKIGKSPKTIQGTTACFLFNFIALIILFNFLGIKGIKIFLFLFLCSVAGTIAEFLEIKIKGKKINDNITMPVISGIIIFILHLLIF
ncbi:MAG: hypothetical protein B6U87_01805 [Candidatus Aenigmarchaeota archaeon ex4484_52]|nr:MAG: hypothetical protein B6U87_01805 [Candidatus Aenigmarchaeota archaeon ex4484_52]